MKHSRYESIFADKRAQSVPVEIMTDSDKTNIAFESARRVNDPLLKGTLWGIQCVEMMLAKRRVE